MQHEVEYISQTIKTFVYLNLLDTSSHRRSSVSARRAARERSSAKPPSERLFDSQVQATLQTHSQIDCFLLFSGIFILLSQERN